LLPDRALIGSGGPIDAQEDRQPIEPEGVLEPGADEGSFARARAADQKRERIAEDEAPQFFDLAAAAMEERPVFNRVRILAAPGLIGV
jgi:hypothetical protein